MILKLLDADRDGIFFVGGDLLTTTWPFGLPSVPDGSTGRPFVPAAIAGLCGCIAVILENMDRNCVCSRSELQLQHLGQTTCPRTSLLVTQTVGPEVIQSRAK